MWAHRPYLLEVLHTVFFPQSSKIWIVLSKTETHLIQFVAWTLENNKEYNIANLRIAVIGGSVMIVNWLTSAL